MPDGGTGPGREQELLALLLLVSAVATDAWRRRFYNGQAVLFAVAGFALSAWSGGGAGLLSAALGAGAGLGLLLPLYAAGWVGGGDAKLACALGAAVGVPALLPCLLWTAVFGGVFAVALSLQARRFREVVARLAWAATHLTRFQRLPPDTGSLRIPLAPAFLLGFVSYLLSYQAFTF